MLDTTTKDRAVFRLAGRKVNVYEQPALTYPFYFACTCGYCSPFMPTYEDAAAGARRHLHDHPETPHD